MNQVNPPMTNSPVDEEEDKVITPDALPPDIDTENNANSAATNDWQLWPPSPKVQILLIAAVFGVFNLILIVIWAVVMVYRFP